MHVVTSLCVHIFKMLGLFYACMYHVCIYICSLCDTLEDIKKVATALVGKPNTDSTRMWHYFSNGKPYVVLCSLEKTLEG